MNRPDSEFLEFHLAQYLGCLSRGKRWTTLDCKLTSTDLRLSIRRTANHCMWAKKKQYELFDLILSCFTFISKNAPYLFTTPSPPIYKGAMDLYTQSQLPRPSISVVVTGPSNGRGGGRMHTQTLLNIHIRRAPHKKKDIQKNIYNYVGFWVKLLYYFI